MHSVCKFVPSSKLSTVELDKVLTPDECLGPFSRARNTADILKQLPKSFADQLPLSAKRTPQSLTSALRTELVKGRWIAVSTFARKVPLTEAQLQAFPVLKAYMMPQIAPEKVKVHKASYQQVLDDVPLARNLTFVAPEPSPDDKIVVEFAGQWSGNAACLMLSKTEQQREKVTSARPDFEHAHRSLATFKDLESEPKTLYIKIPCQGQPQPILLKLAEGLMPVSQDTQMPEWDNVLIPVRPLAYLDASQDKAKASELRGGFLYVFWQGKLWRELAINDKGYYQDIDVEYYRILEQEQKQQKAPQVIVREPIGFAIPQFWAPYKIMGELQQGETGLKIVFSPKQKRFRQIEDLESDPAKLAKVSTPLDELSSYSDAQGFHAQSFTSDVDSASIHPVTEEDMPWLSDQQAIVRSYDQSNTVIAYVDGKNNGFVLSVETGLIDFDTSITHYVVVSDSESDWVLSEVLQYNQDNPHFATAHLGGFPPKGKFTLQVTSPAHTHHSEVVFRDLTFEQILAWSDSTNPAPELEPLPELSEQEQTAADNLNDYMTLWREELGFSQ
ncbi:hypothetical protein [Vibrio caribbeanicus]|uniref:hypothetical protein n=1 Tax=Vibrio caribbeanicus TaxID=701175 RepID=UPI00228432FF|nr:hypothetical protein [Vibrio caribbeanicus]MCY9845976.1 hypothetical protein [Vibrio caribbeanicus]